MEVWRTISRAWMEKIKRAVDYKRKEFQDDADEAVKFFDGPYHFMYGSQYAAKVGALRLGTDVAMPNPTFQMTLNKVAEMVQIFGPVLYHRNPHRQVTTRKLPPYPYELLGDPEDPQVQQMAMMLQQMDSQHASTSQIMADLIETYINYTPNELNLQEHARLAIDEAIIKGASTLWVETFTPPGSPYRLVGSFFDSIDNLVVDPDMESIADAKYVARRRVLPKYEVESRFGLPAGTLTDGNLESIGQQSDIHTSTDDYNYYRQRGDTNDLLTYWEVYSRMGFGQNTIKKFEEDKAVKRRLDKFGPYVFLAVCEDYAYPLNLPASVWKRIGDEKAFYRVQWPTPFWGDPTDPWPFALLQFHPRPRKVWPMSHLKPGLGQLQFLNWAFSFLADKVKNTSRDFIAGLKSVLSNVEFRDALMSGRDLTVLEVESPNNSINEVVQFLQHPPFNKDLLIVVAEMMDAFEKAVGLNELIYGTTKRQMRSAHEAQLKSDQLKIRPDDMAAKVESFMTVTARKEAITSRWHLQGQDVVPVIGPARAQLWDQFVVNSEIPTLFRELDYRVEAGSIRKPNRDRDIANANSALQVLGPVFQFYTSATGDFSPMNALVQMWAKAYDIDPEQFILRPPPPPQPDQSEIQQRQMELEQQQLENQMALQHKEQLQQQKLTHKEQEEQFKLAAKQADHLRSLLQGDDVHEQELDQDQEEHLQEMLQARQEGQLDLWLKRQLASVASSNGQDKD